VPNAIPITWGHLTFSVPNPTLYSFRSVFTTLNELGLARMVIEILQKELLTTTATKNMHGNELASTEGFVNTNLRREKIKSRKWENNNILKLQQSQPIPVVVNKCAPLDGLQEELVASQNYNRTSEVTLLRKKKKCPPNTKKRKIVIIGDSRARGYVAEISSGLGKDFEITGTVIPGARLENITNLADGEISTLVKSDTVIVIGGANDINKNEANFGLKHLGIFVKKQAKHKYHNSNCPP
jgi:hypothetical protein